MFFGSSFEEIHLDAARIFPYYRFSPLEKLERLE